MDGQSTIQLWLAVADVDCDNRVQAGQSLDQRPFTTELLGWCGIPAIPHGNVIEVATGMVGIDEACSGIRSFQATLMISLFLGELYRLGFARRLGLVFGGFALSFLFNVARMSLLVWAAARKDVTAIAVWYDPAGVTILVACFFGLWGLGVWLRRKPAAENQKQKFEKLEIQSPSTLNFQPAMLRTFAIALCTRQREIKRSRFEL